MDHKYLALNTLKKYIGEKIPLEKIGTESYVFEVDELDPMITPPEYQAILTNYKEVMTHTYSYKSIVVYVIVPLEKRDDEDILIGVLEEGELIDYVFVK